MLSNEQLQTLMAVARKVHASTIAPKGYSEETVFAVMLAGAELGFEPMQSLSAFHVIQGRLSLRADFVVALCVRSPVCKHFTLVESTDKVATYETLREGHAAPTRMSFTIEQAQRAKLMGNTLWSTHPDAMLRARCSARLARAVYPDAAAGIIVPDEAEEIAANDSSTRPALVTRQPVRELPSTTEPTEAPALAAYRARIAACQTSGELVAVRLALGPTLRPLSAEEQSTAKALTRQRATELFGNTDDYDSAFDEAKALSTESSHWSAVAAALAAMQTADTREAVDAAAKAHATSLAALPVAIKGRVEMFLRSRRTAVSQPAAAPQVSLAAELEEALRAADGIPALDDLADRFTREALAGRITREQAAKLSQLHEARVAEYEREPATDEAA